MKKTNYDPKKDYYKIFGLNDEREFSKERVYNLYKWYSDLCKDIKNKSDRDLDYYRDFAEAYNVLINEDLREQYDESRKAYFKKLNKVDDVDEEVPEETMEKAKKTISKKDLRSLIAIIAALAVLGTSGYLLHKKNKEKREESSISDMSGEDVPSEVVAKDMEEVENVDKVNDENFMMSVAKDSWEEIANIKSSNSSYAPSINDVETVYELIRWAHHNNQNYSGEYILSNEYAYSLMAELVDTPLFNVAKLFEGLDSYETINEAWTDASLIEDNNLYSDEIKACKSLNSSMTRANQNDYPEIITLTAILDKTMDLKIKYFNIVDELKNNGNVNEANEMENMYRTTLDRSSDMWIFKDAIEMAINEDSSLKRG